LCMTTRAPAWERTVLPALPAGCEAEPRRQRVTRQSPVTRAFASRTGCRSASGTYLAGEPVARGLRAQIT
jgi:hypothetical protein